MRLLITEATEARILQLTEQGQKHLTFDDPGIAILIEEIESDLLHADRIEGDIYEY